MNTGIAAGIPDRQLTTNQTVVRDTGLENKLLTRYVWFCGDTIEPQMKYTMPDRAFGGLLADSYDTLKHNGNPGILYRCRITPLKPYMRKVNRNMVSPTDAQNWVQSYAMQSVRADGSVETVTVRDRNMVYKQAFPSEDVVRITTDRRAPHGEGGVVELTALVGADEAFAAKVQEFFFPEWGEIERGYKMLPKTVDALEAHLSERMLHLGGLPDGVRDVFAQCGRDMLRGVGAYRNWGMQYLKSIEDAFSAAKVKGVPFSYPPKAEMLLAQLGQVRKDDLATTQAVSSQALIEAMAKQNELKERELALKEAELAAMKANNAAPAATARPSAPVKVTVAPAEPKEPVTETVAAPVEGRSVLDILTATPAAAANPETCSVTTSQGKPCKGAVVQTVDGVGYCYSHRKEEGE